MYRALSLPSDPIRTLQRRFRAIVFAGGCALLAVVGGSLLMSGPEPTPLVTIDPPAESVRSKPLDATDPPEDPPEAPPEEPSDENAWDMGVFTVRLWNPPPPPDEPADEEKIVEPPRRLPPPQVDLIAITSTGTERIAAVFDSRQNELLMLRLGDEVQGYTIESIRADSVTMAAGRTSHHLLLVQHGGQ